MLRLFYESRINYLPEKGKEHYLGGSKYTDGSLVRVNEHGQDLVPPDSRGVGRERSSIPESNAFELEQDGERKMMLLEADLHAEGGRLVATIRYVPEVGVFPQQDYVMELSR